MQHTKWFFSLSLLLVLSSYFYMCYQAPPTLPNSLSLTPAPLRIVLQPLGEIDPQYIQLARQELAAFYGAEVTLLTTQPLPDSAYYAPRKRYRASVLLKHLLLLRPSDSDYIVGLTAKDISTTKGEHYDWGILGLGYCPGKSCVVSTYRLRRSARDQHHVAQRFAKVILHEVGHNLGLRHCHQSTTCLMRDACGTIKTIDHESKGLCPNCQKLIAHKVLLPAPN